MTNQPTWSASTRQIILDALADECFQTGTFTLASGVQSDYYLDCSHLLRRAYLGALGRLFADRIERLELSADVLAGPGFGAAPLITATLIEIHRSTTGLDVQPSDGILIRPADPKHGRSGRLDGPILAKRRQRIILVDDVFTSGGTLLEAASLLRSCGHDVLAAVVLVDRSVDAPEGVGIADLDFPHYSIFKIDDIIKHAAKVS